MKLISALACVSVLTFASAAVAQDQPAPTPPAQPAAPATPATPAQPETQAAPPAAATPPAMAAPTYGKGWNAKKCADAKTKGKTTPDGACPSEMAPK